MPGRLSAWSANLIRGYRCDALGNFLQMHRRVWPVFLILAACSCHSGGGFSPIQSAGAAEGTILRISIERTGGVAGITIRSTVDAKDLAPEEGQKLRQMVEESNFFNLPAKIASRSPQPDRFQYELTVEEEGRRHTVMVSEEVMPEKLKLLARWLMEKARSMQRGTGPPS